jgi:hypothetical protein
MFKALMRVSALALFALSAATTTSLMAQTAGGSDLDQLRYVLNGSFDAKLAGNGTELLLNDDVNHILVTKTSDRFMVMSSSLGSLSSFSRSQRLTLNRTLNFMNTALPVGTFHIQGNNLVMEHHVNAEWMTIGAIADVVRTFERQVQESRKQIFG